MNSKRTYNCKRCVEGLPIPLLLTKLQKIDPICVRGVSFIFANNSHYVTNNFKGITFYKGISQL